MTLNRIQRIYLFFFGLCVSTMVVSTHAVEQSCIAERSGKLRQFEQWLDNRSEPKDLDIKIVVNILTPFSKKNLILARHVFALFESGSLSVMVEYAREIGIDSEAIAGLKEAYANTACESDAGAAQREALSSSPAQRAHGVQLAHAAQALMANAYNSCEVLDIREMKRSDPDLQGLTIVGTHPNVPSVDLFKITKLSDFLQSHFYYNELRSMTRRSPQCRSSQSLQMFYRFGGKPAALDRRSEFSMKSSEGSGGDHLGVDCSGFVLAALFAKGARVSPGLPINTDLFQLIPSRKLKSPSPAGFNCLTKMDLQKSPEPLDRGDMVATDWHIFMVDQIVNIGSKSDPFGYRKYGNQFSCEKLKISDFNFTLIQSSATHMIGINRMEIRDFLNSDIDQIQVMAKDLLNYAQLSCAKELSQMSLAKKLESLVAKSTTSVVRHSSHSSCQQAPLHFEEETCGLSCSNLE